MAAMAVALVVLMVAAAPAVQGVEHIVGGNSEWNEGVDYPTWVSSNTFAVGDTLLFKYGATHKVDEVNKADYDSCSFNRPIQSHSDGNTSIPLLRVGPYYFVCPISDHCSSGGMKLALNVTTPTSGPSGSPPTSPSSPPAPSGSTAPNTPPSEVVPPPPSTTTPSAAVGMASNMKLLGATAVLAALLVAFMG